MKITALCLSSSLFAMSGMAFAQAPPTPSTPPAKTASPAPSAPAVAGSAAACAPHDTAAPNSTTTGEAREPLSDKLAKSDGVICPPTAVDPEIRAPTPEGGNTPVIPPPGSPGGDPTVRPK